MAAGLGFKDFVTGEVLTAADVDGYLMQGIWVFASTAARNAAVTAPAEGNFAFTKDTNSLWYYDGAAWVASGATGDIEGVTAGTGISGGGTSGTVTVTNSMATAIDAKGDLVVGTGADTFSKLTVGTNGYLLTADSAEATGLKWAAAAAAGGGLDLISTTSFSAVSSVSVSSCFSATYDNYLIKLNSTTVASSNSSISLRLRVGGTDTTTNYRTQYIAGNGATVSGGRSITETSFGGIGYVQPAFNNEFTLNITNPYNTVITTGFTNSVQVGGGNIESYIAAFGLNDTTSYPGFTIISPNNLTGSVSVYGYKK